MSDIKVTIVGAAIAVSVAGQPIAITTVGQQGPSGPAVPTLSNTYVLFSDSNQVGASPNFTFDKTTNVVTVTGNLQATNYLHHSTGSAALAAAGLQAGSGHSIGFSSIANATGTMDTMLRRGGAGILEQRNGVSAQEFRLFNSTDGTNKEYTAFWWTSNTMHIVTEKTGTGAARALVVGTNVAEHLYLRTNGSNRWQVNNTAGHLHAVTDNTYDIGGTSTGRPRNLAIAGNLTVGTKLTVDATNTIIDTNFLFNTDNAKDMGTSTAFRPRDVYVGRSGYFGTSAVLPAGTKTVGAVQMGGNGHLYARAGTLLNLSNGTSELYSFQPGLLMLASSVALGWSASNPDALSMDLQLFRGGAGILEQRNGASAQEFRLYETFTDASNYGRLTARYDTGVNVWYLETQAGGTGTLRGLRLNAASYAIQTGGVNRISIDSSGNIAPVTDNATDLGVLGSARWRSGFFGTSVNTPAVLSPTGLLTVSSVFQFGSYIRGNATTGVLVNNATDTLNIVRFNNDGTTEFFGHVRMPAGNTNSLDLGAPGQLWRSGFFGTSVLVSGTGGIGYSSGAGGTVVQATNKSTGVTLNKPTGVITMASGSLAANGVASFVLTNSTIAATDHVIVTVQGGATGAGYLCTTVTSAGAATVHVRNVTAGALDEPVQLRFTVLKSVNS